MSTGDNKKRRSPAAGLLAPENRIFAFIAVVVIVVTVAAAFGLYRWLTIEDPVAVDAGRVDASGLDAEAGAKSTEAYKEAMAERDRRSLEAARNRPNGVAIPFAFDEDPVEPSGHEGQTIGECECQMSEERFREMLRRVGGTISSAGQKDAMRVENSDIYLSTKLKLVDQTGEPLQFRGNSLFMDKSGALLDENGVGLLSGNNDALYLSKSGQFLDANAKQVKLRGELIEHTGRVLLGSGEYATRPDNMKRAGLSDIYVTRDGQLVTLDGRGIRHSGAFVFRNEEKQLLNANGAEAAWNRQAVFQNNDGQLVNVAGKKFGTTGILFSYDGILIDNDGKLTQPLVDIERIAKTDIFKNKSNHLVDGNGAPLLHYGAEVRLGQGNRLIASGGATVANRQGNPVHLSQSGKFATDVGGGAVQTGFIKSADKTAYNSNGARIGSDGTIIRRGDSDIYTTGDGFLADREGRAIQFYSKDTFLDYDRSLADGSNGLITYDGTIVTDAFGQEVFLSEDGALIDKFGDVVDQAGLLADAEGVLLTAEGKKIIADSTMERVTTKDGTPVTLNGQAVYRGEDGALLDADGNPILTDDGRAVFMDENGRIVDEFGRVVEDMDLRAGDRAVQNGELTTRKAVTTGSGESVFFEGKKVFTDASGRLVDENGDVVTTADGRELYLDRDGNIVDPEGKAVDENILTTRTGESVSSGLVSGREQVVTKSGSIVTYDGKAVFRGENGTLVDEDGNAIRDEEGNRLYIDDDGNIVNARGEKVEDSRLRVAGENLVASGVIATKKVLTDKDGNLLTYNGQPVYTGDDGLLYDKNNRPIKTSDGRDVYVNDRGDLVDKSGRKIEEPVLSVKTREEVTKGALKGREQLLDADGSAVTMNGKPVYVGEDGQLFDAEGNVLRDDEGSALSLSADDTIVNEKGEIAKAKGLSTTGVQARDVRAGELVAVRKLTDANGEALTLDGEEVYVDDQGRIVDSDGNLVRDSSGQPVFFDEESGRVVNAAGEAIEEGLLKDANGNYVKEDINAGKRQVISKQGGVLTVAGKEAFVSEDGHLVDADGKALLSRDGKKLFLDKDGNLIDADGKTVRDETAQIRTKSGLIRTGETVKRDVIAGELQKGKKLLGNDGKALKFQGKDVYVDEQGRLLDADGKVVTDSNGRAVYFDEETGALVDVSGRKINEKLLSDSEGNLVNDGIKTGKEQVISTRGGILTVDGEEAFVSEDGHLVDSEGNALLTSGGKKMFLDSDGNLIDEAGNRVDDHKAKIEQKTQGLRQAVTDEGGVLQYNGEDVFLDENGFLVDSSGNAVRAANGERVRMEDGSLVTESGEEVSDPAFSVVKTDGISSGIIAGKEQLITKDGESIKYKGDDVFRSKDGRLVTASGEPVLTSDGRLVFAKEDGTLVDENGKVIDEPLLTSRSGAVKSGDLTTAPVTDMRRIGKSDVFVAKDGSLLDSKGRALTYNGKRVKVNENGALVDQDGNLVTDRNGNPVFMNAEGKFVDRNGRLIEDSILADGDDVLIASDGKSVSQSLDQMGNSDIYTTMDGRLVDEDGKAIKYKGKDVYRGEDGRLRYANGQIVQDERGRSVYMNEAGQLVDKDGQTIAGNILTDSDGVLIDNNGEKLNAGGKLTRIEGTDYYRAENGQVVTADGTPAIIDGSEVYVDEQGRLVTPHGRAIRYKGKELYLGADNRLLTADGKGVSEDNKQLYLGKAGIVDEDGQARGKPAANQPGFTSNEPPKPQVRPEPIPPEPEPSPADESTEESSESTEGATEDAPPDASKAIPLDGDAAARFTRRYALVKAAMRKELAEIEGAAASEAPKLQSIGYTVSAGDPGEDSGVGPVGVGAETPGSSEGGSGTVAARAGTTLYAINAMKLNSDYSNRVIVDIVGRPPSDPLYGAKGIGQFERKYKKLVLSLSKISTVKYGVLEMDGLALDVKTAEVGLASDVDSHFWYRYGGLFAATMLSGISEAAAASGTREETITPTGTRVTTTGLEGEELLGRAVGATGDTFTQVLAGNVTRPPTAMLAPGEEMAVILFDDIEIPRTK